MKNTHISKKKAKQLATDVPKDIRSGVRDILRTKPLQSLQMGIKHSVTCDLVNGMGRCNCFQSDKTKAPDKTLGEDGFMYPVTGKRKPALKGKKQYLPDLTNNEMLQRVADHLFHYSTIIEDLARDVKRVAFSL